MYAVADFGSDMVVKYFVQVLDDTSVLQFEVQYV